MQNEREKQANFDVVDSEDTLDTEVESGEERMRKEQMVEEGRQQRINHYRGEP